MSPRNLICERIVRFTLAMTIAWTAAATTGPVFAGGNNFRSSVGGIAVNALGVVSKISVEDRNELRKSLRADLEPIPNGMSKSSGMRKVSLRKLQSALGELVRSGGDLPDDVRYLAGLQRIEYVFVYPEHHDIVLVGPGDGWRIDDNANVVGLTNGRPILQLDDLLVALRTIKPARAEGISCSIEPTKEGRVRLMKYLSKQKEFHQRVPQEIERTLGRQNIIVTGVPLTSHFAHVLVAADIRMKRIAMKLDESPIETLTSYMDMLQPGSKATSLMPRWWLACDYDPLARSEDGLAWQLRGNGVKCMTQEDFVAADGTTEASDEKNPVAQRWADMMSLQYSQLASKETLFAELRNLMDLCVVAALIEVEGLTDKSGLSLSFLTDPHGDLMLESWNPPRGVPSQVSLVKKEGRYIISASGGVEIDSFFVASRSEVVEIIGGLRRESPVPDDASWWWN